MALLLTKLFVIIGYIYTVTSAGVQIESLELPLTCERKTKQGDFVKVHYKGTLKDDENTFDSSYSRGEPFGFVLGNGDVIKGWDQGLVGMCKGESRRLTIPPELAYGEKGAGNVIPGGATLVFEIEIVEIKEAPKASNIFTDIDKDGDNLLSQDEMAEYFMLVARLYGEGESLELDGGITPLIADLMLQQDTNRDGYLSKEEFMNTKTSPSNDPKFEL